MITTNYSNGGLIRGGLSDSSMEKHDATPKAPLVIEDMEEKEGKKYTCYSHKAVKTAMSLIQDSHTDVDYQMHSIGPYDLFSLIDFTRADCMKIMNKIILASDKHGYINKNSGKILKVEIEAREEHGYRNDGWKDYINVNISMGTHTIETEEEE